MPPCGRRPGHQCPARCSGWSRAGSPTIWVKTLTDVTIAVVDAKGWSCLICFGLVIVGVPMAWLGASVADPPGVERPSLGVVIQTSGYLCSLFGIVVGLGLLVWIVV